MKREAIKKLRYTVLILAAVLIGLVITKAVIVDAETDKQLEQIDKFIAQHEFNDATLQTSCKSDAKTAKNDDEIKKTEQKVQFKTISDLFLTDELSTDFAPTSQEETTLAQEIPEEVVISPEEFQVLGIIDWGEWRYTYYSEKVLPGEGLNIPGRWSDGVFVRDENGYLCVASNITDLPYGTNIETPFGTGIVYDCGCDPGIIDIYVSW